MARGDDYLSARESRRISEENRKITAKLEKARTQRNMPGNEHMTEMKSLANAVEFEDLHTFFFTDAGTIKSVGSVGFETPLGKTAGVMGELDCDKSVTSLSLMQLLQRPQGQVVESSIRLNTEDKVYEITKIPENAMQHLRGNFMSMTSQELTTPSDPVFCIGDQMNGVTMPHKKSEYPTKETVKGCTIEPLKMVGITNSEGVYNVYPHEPSGGVRQRAIIVMALTCLPKLIIADEPAVAPDVTIQAQVLDPLCGLKDEINSPIMLITHDLGVIAEMANYVVVMCSGRVVGAGTAKEVSPGPMHSYTTGLMTSKLVVGKHQDKLYSIPGKVPNPINMPNYCYSRDRCDEYEGCCDGAYPGEIWFSKARRVSCYRCDEVRMGSGQSKA